MSATSTTLAGLGAEDRLPAGTGSRGMGLGQSIATAFEAIGGNKVRALLTMLGIIIGVGAVIVVIALGQGSSASVQQRLAGLGTNVLTISPGSTGFGGFRAGAGSQNTLTEADASAISSQISGIAGVSPVISGNVQVVAGNQNWSTRVSAVYPSYQTIENWQPSAGSLLTGQDEQSQANVVVLGQTVVDNLYGNGSAGSGSPSAAIGQTIRINNVPFQVEGVLTSKGGQTDQDDFVLVPFTTGKIRLFNRTYVNQIVAQVTDASQMTAVQNQITSLMRLQHRLTVPTNDFNVRNNNTIVQSAQSVSQTMTLLLTGVAAVSLIVGGIGIMNIMLVSVTERTREIGIRIAIGARMRDVMRQFLIEAITLSALGGLIGVAVGVVATMVLSRLAGWSTLIAPTSMVLSFGFAALVGIFFGWYPARKASQLNPIEALRYE